MTKDNIIMTIAGILCLAIGVFKLVTVGLSWDTFLILGGIVLLIAGLVPLITKNKG